MRTRLIAVLGALLLGLSACATTNPLSSSSAAPAGSASASGSASTAAGGNLVVGSQAYYSNEIIAELYAQALEAKGYKVTRQYQIGQREVYLPELKAGKIDVFPEYSGNLLVALDAKTTAKSGEEVLAGLKTALPQGLRMLTAAAASDQDSYNVTKEIADKYGLASISDLSKLPAPVKVAANSELQKRSYGPTGLKNLYGLDVEVVPVEDSGGPLTVKALKDGKAQVADVYSADPNIAKNGLVTLTDPKNLILPQNVVPIVSSKVDDAAAAVIDKVNAQLSTAELVALNAKSVDTQASSAALAKEWLAAKGLG